MRHHLLSASLAVAASLAAQRTTWIVDSRGGPGVHFTDIPPAVAAAAAGDRIEVRGNGTYSGFTLNRGIEVEAVQGATVPNAWVINVPTTESTSVRGFVLDGYILPYPYFQHAAALGCRGPVIFSALTFNEVQLGAVGLNGCDDVLILDCSARRTATVAPTPRSTCTRAA